MPFTWIREDQPGPLWKERFDRAWPTIRHWFLAEGDSRRPDRAESHAALARHMPELVPLWERLVELSGGSDEVARMLSLYCPTPYLAGCSQAIWKRDEPVLVRNYDYHPAACEGTFLLSRWDGTSVLAASDGLWGALDGMNEHGLVVALAFGGRRAVGDGFGIPLVLRYALQTCTSTAEAVAALVRVPSHMAYNVSVLDAAGAHALVVLAPDHAPLVTDSPVATNHQHNRDWSEHSILTKSDERERILKEGLSNPALDREAFKNLFLAPPLYSTEYARAFGTLYTAAYFPARRRMEVYWPGTCVSQGFDDFRDHSLVVPLSAATARPSGA